MIGIFGFFGSIVFAGCIVAVKILLNYEYFSALVKEDLKSSQPIYQRQAEAIAIHKAQDKELVRKIRREHNPECARLYNKMLMKHRGEL